MKRKYLYLFICTIVLAFVFSLTAFAYGYMPPTNPDGDGDIFIVPESTHKLQGVTVTLLDVEYQTAIFTIDYYNVDFQGFFNSSVQTYSQYIGWQAQLETQGTWLNDWVYGASNRYSNWFEFALVVNEALGNWRRADQLSVENGLLNENLDGYATYIDELETRITGLENDLADGGRWQDGYNAGISDGQNVSNGIISIFTAPLTFLSGWFNFTIFGINFASLIKFFVSLALVAWLLKKLKTESE